MNHERLPYRASVEEYDAQARDLLRAYNSADQHAIALLRNYHPLFRRADVPWLARPATDAEVVDQRFTLDDCRMAVARAYDFLDWPSLVAYAEAVNVDGSPIQQFEDAIEAVITGNEAALRAMLQRNPELARARSFRACCFDPPVHRATLLHYLAANGVEGYRQKTPPNAVAIANLLLDAGADPDGLADLYGGKCSVMSMLVSSCHPAEAGVQVALVHALCDRGGSVEPLGEGRWKSPLITALLFGYVEAARALVERGAQVGDIVAAAGLGRTDDVRAFLPAAAPEERHRALAIATNVGAVEVVRCLLEAREDPNRYHPDGFHAHATPLHQAALADNVPLAQLLVQYGAQLNLRDKIYNSTPLGWAEYLKKPNVAAYLRSMGAEL